MTIRVLYFAWFREKVGMASEDVVLPTAVRTVAELVAWLKDRNTGHAAAFADPSVVRVAVNQEYVKLDHAVKPGDEVAFFPPVTGG